MFAAQLEKRVGNSFVVEARPGFSSTIASKYVVSSPPDGYTLLSVTMSAHPILVANNGVDITKEMTIISTLISTPVVVVTQAGLPLKSLSEVVSYSKANPGKLNYASPNSAPVDVLLTLLSNRTGLTYTLIPYKGPVEAQRAIATGEAQITATTMASAIPSVQSGKAVAILFTSTARSPLIPDAMTLPEVGIHDIKLGNYVWFVAPLGTPQSILRRLNTEAAVIAKIPEYSQRATAIFGMAPIGDTPEEALTKASQEIVSLAEGMRLGNFKPQ
jgi:tripartite-type tricarboxylate transporter receptor subunit TctC